MSESTPEKELPHHVKYKESVEAYQKTLWRHSIAVKDSFKAPITALVEASGANSLSELMCAMSVNREELAPQLEKMVSDFRQRRENSRAAKAGATGAIAAARKAGLSDEAIAELLLKAAGEKNSNQGGQ